MGPLDHPLLSRTRERSLGPAALVQRLGLPSTAIIADIGAGPGLFTLPFARAVASGRVIATDIRSDLLEIAKTRAHASGLTNIETRLVEASQTGLAPSSVDLAFLCQVDHYLADRAGYFAKLKVALRAGGRIVIVNTPRLRDPALAAAHQAGLRIVSEWRIGSLYFAVVLKPERAQ
jgi:ubiquinone/menaquinone biosynthesis C-methylase UbiE